ncbi:hypothetical protein RUM43_008367 [Polyplax serrata]|uniref:Uncharacterized protein n=1 Tax=Polyplax serrata TaxID=468196 RepID=A0AAN8P6Y3_POLSC
MEARGVNMFSHLSIVTIDFIKTKKKLVWHWIHLKKKIGRKGQKAAYVWSQDQNILANSTATSKGQPHGHGPNPGQGLVHWMSVMAEHMNNVNQENPMHYVWNNMEVRKTF